jgi:serine/threonine protein phosphatase PrpC
MSWFLNSDAVIATTAPSGPATSASAVASSKVALQVMCGGFQKNVKGEDRFMIHDATIGGDSCYFTLVADGHGGKDAAQLAAQRILPFIAQEAKDGSGAELHRACVKGICALHADICASGTTSGSTLTVCCINASLHELHVWNVGDSLAVLVDTEGHAPLGVSHRLEDNPDEQARIQALGVQLGRAMVDGKPGGPLRAWPGGLAVTRCVGDADCHFVIPEPAWSTCPAPPKGGALLACTDGVWDLMSADEAAMILVEGAYDSAREAARQVVHKAMCRGLIDDTTSVAMLFGPAVMDDGEMANQGLEAAAVEGNATIGAVQEPARRQARRIRKLSGDILFDVAQSAQKDSPENAPTETTPSDAPWMLLADAAHFGSQNAKLEESAQSTHRHTVSVPLGERPDRDLSPMPGRPPRGGPPTTAPTNVRALDLGALGPEVPRRPGQLLRGATDQNTSPQCSRPGTDRSGTDRSGTDRSGTDRSSRSSGSRLASIFDSVVREPQGKSGAAPPWTGLGPNLNRGENSSRSSSPQGRSINSSRDTTHRFALKVIDAANPDGLPRRSPPPAVADESTSTDSEEFKRWSLLYSNPGEQSAKPSQATRVVDFSKLIITKYLGQGEFARAHETTLDGRPAAIKMLKNEKQEIPSAVQGLKREIMMMTLMDQPNVLKAYALGQHEGIPLMIVELLSRTLNSELPRDPDAVPFWVRWQDVARWPLSRSLHCAVQLARALKYCHDDAFPGYRILHRDVKPNNIGFIHDPEDPDHLVLFDFGLASLWEKKGDPTDTLARNLTGETGSLRYMSPEVVHSKPYCPKAEVFSFATVTYEIASCKKPFTNLLPDAFRKAIGNGYVPEIPRKWPAELQSLISLCWKLDAQQRPEFREIVPCLEALCAKHPYQPQLIPKKTFWESLIGSKARAATMRT